MGIFSVNSPIMKGISKLVMMIYVGILWFLCSIPVFTIGASTTAMYEVLIKAVKDQEGYVGSSFLKAFRRNFKQGICVWLPILLASILFSVNLFYYGIIGRGSFPVQTVIFSLLTLLMPGVSAYIFPIMAKFENTIKGHFLMTFMLMIRNPGWTVVLILIQIMTLFLIYFFMYFPVMFIMGISGYVQAVITNHIFDRLIDKGMIKETDNQK